MYASENEKNGKKKKWFFGKNRVDGYLDQLTDDKQGTYYLTIPIHYVVDTTYIIYAVCIDLY